MRDHAAPLGGPAARAAVQEVLLVAGTTNCSMANVPTPSSSQKAMGTQVCPAARRKQALSKTPTPFRGMLLHLNLTTPTRRFNSWSTSWRTTHSGYRRYSKAVLTTPDLRLNRTMSYHFVAHRNSCMIPRSYFGKGNPSANCGSQK